MKFETPELNVIILDNIDILTNSQGLTTQPDFIGTIPPGGLPMD